MRVSDDRYHRDQLRLDIALRFIRHEARTHTIRAWTGLTDDRIRKLYRSYLSDAPGTHITRHRGKSPQQIAFFTRNERARQESALLASLFRLTGVLPSAPVMDARALPTVARGEVLCQAYETFRHLIGEPQISFEHAVFLVMTLALAQELTLGGCVECAALVVVDRLSVRAARCSHCASLHAPVASLAKIE